MFIVYACSSHFKHGDPLVKDSKQYYVTFTVHQKLSPMNFASVYTFGTQKFNYGINLTITVFHQIMITFENVIKILTI